MNARILRRLACSAALIVTFVPVGGTLVAARRAARPVTHTVMMDGTQFQPASLTVRPGDTVVWVNKDPFPHTVMSQAGAFSSPVILVGKSWSFTAEQSGQFPYVCTLHPTMKGTLTVK